jgi:hypothetical protein
MLEYEVTVSGVYRMRVMMVTTPDVPHEWIGIAYKITF